MSKTEEKKCEHDLGDCWQSEKDGGCSKSFSPICPYCKPSPSQGCEYPHSAGGALMCPDCGGDKSNKEIKPGVFAGVHFCKPTAVEPSVEEIADEVMRKIAFEIGRQPTGTNQNRVARAVIIEALRNERNRK